jgi:N-acyl-D-amino-acid deacylase
MKEMTGKESGAPVLLENGLIFDGLGSPPREGSVLVLRDEVAAVGEVSSALIPAGTLRVNVKGLAVCPGFINIHSHSDTDMLMHPESKTLLKQGITTEVVGNCGGGPVDGLRIEEKTWQEIVSCMIEKGAPRPPVRWTSLAGYLDTVSLGRPAANVACLFGHGDVRRQVLGDDEDGKPLNEERRRSAALIACKYMEEGAFGVSSGLEYVPGRCADAEELAAVAKPVAEFGGFHASHIRNEGPHLLESVKEIIAVAERSGVRSEVSHLKAVGPANWGKVKDALALMDEANGRGLTVNADFYPYLASSTGLSIVLPDWVLERGNTHGLEILRNPELRPRAVLESDQRTETQGGWHRVVITGAQKPENRWMEGMDLASIAAKMGTHPAESAVDILLAEDMRVRIARFAMDEDDLVCIIRHPGTCVVTDGWNGVPEKGKTHPRSVGTFPRVLGHYARDKGVISMEEAIRKMTSLPAQRLGIKNRGTIAPGYKADLIVFDPDKIIDKATYDDPWQYPEGIESVYVNGVLVIDGGDMTGRRPGLALRKG